MEIYWTRCKNRTRNIGKNKRTRDAEQETGDDEEKGKGGNGYRWNEGRLIRKKEKLAGGPEMRTRWTEVKEGKSAKGVGGWGRGVVNRLATVR